MQENSIKSSAKRVHISFAQDLISNIIGITQPEPLQTGVKLLSLLLQFKCCVFKLFPVYFPTRVRFSLFDESRNSRRCDSAPVRYLGVLRSICWWGFLLIISTNQPFPKPVQCEIEGANLYKYISLGVVAYPGSWPLEGLRVRSCAYV